MFVRQDGIVSHKLKINIMFELFDRKITRFKNLFELQIMIENAKKLKNLQSQEYFEDIQVTTEIIKKYYDIIFFYEKNNFQQNFHEVDTNWLDIIKWYQNISKYDLNEINIFIDQLENQIINNKKKFILEGFEIHHQCKQIIELLNVPYNPKYKIMVELISHTHYNIIQKIMAMNQQQLKSFKNKYNFQFLSVQIQQFIHIYSLKLDFQKPNLTKMCILLQYFEALLDNQLEPYQYVDFLNLENLENVRDPKNINQIFSQYQINVREEFSVKFIQNTKITKKIHKKMRKTFKTQLIQELMYEVQQQLNLPIDLSLDFLSYVGLIIIPNCNQKGLTIRDNGININLTPFFNLYYQGLIDGYLDILYAYCILVAINGWNCLQLIKKTQKSFYWYNDSIKHLNLEEFILYKNIFGITYIQENKQLFSLQFLNQSNSKLIINIVEQLNTKEELHQLFKDQLQKQQNQLQLQLFQETIEEQLEMGLKLY